MVKRKPKQSLDNADLGSPERAMRDGGVTLGARMITDGGIVVTHGARATNSSIVEEMRRNKLLDGSQGGKGERHAVAGARYEAAERIHRLFVDAGLHELKAVDMEREASGAGAEVSEQCARARQKFNRIVRSLGPWMESVTMIVLHDKRPRSAVDVRNLCGALDRLCVEFEM